MKLFALFTVSVSLAFAGWIARTTLPKEDIKIADMPIRMSQGGVSVGFKAVTTRPVSDDQELPATRAARREQVAELEINGVAYAVVRDGENFGVLQDGDYFEIGGERELDQLVYRDFPMGFAKEAVRAATVFFGIASSTETARQRSAVAQEIFDELGKGSCSGVLKVGSGSQWQFVVVTDADRKTLSPASTTRSSN